MVRGKVAAAALMIAAAELCRAQMMLTSAESGVRIQQTDMAAFEAGETRSDLPCSVSVNQPVLGFDLRFHTGYEVSIPLKELAGDENMLTVLFRVTRKDGESGPAYFLQRIRVPSIQEEARGDAFVTGVFDTGEGDYHVEWLMRDRMERVCTSFWDVESKLPPKDKQVALALEPGVIQAAEREQFRDEPPVARIQQEDPINVKVVVNFAPQKPNSATLQPIDTSALVSILRSISRDPRIGKFSVVAFNMHEQRVLYRQDQAEKIDFPALGEALNSINLGTVDLRRLSDRNSDVDFLSGLMQTELQAAAEMDAVVFAGPKTLLDESVPQQTLRTVADTAAATPVFYMNYNLYPQTTPWNDAIGKAVKYLKGQEYTISRPRDLWYAVSEMVSRIVKLKQDRRSVTSSSE